MKIHHISEAGVSFEIRFGLWIKIWGWRTHFDRLIRTVLIGLAWGRLPDL